MRRTPQVLNKSELEELLAAAMAPDRTWLLLGCDCGLRNAEIRSITPDHVLRSGLIHVRGKGGVVREVPLTRRLLSWLRAQDLQRVAGRIPDEVPYVTWCARTLQHHFRRLARAAGIYVPGRSPHTLRHTYACRLLRAGVSLPVVQRLLGHANLRTTSIYLHADPEDISAAGELLDRLIQQGAMPLWTRAQRRLF